MSVNKSLMILVAGPYRSGTNDNPELISANVKAMTDAALEIFQIGHLPVLGEWFALPLIDAAGSKEKRCNLWGNLFNSISICKFECMNIKKPLHIKSIREFHQLRGLSSPEQPLISMIDYAAMQASNIDESGGLLLDFYLISVKKGLMGKLKYGQQTYDHDEGVMSFMAPHQLLKIEKENFPTSKRSGWILLIHPNFI